MRNKYGIYQNMKYVLRHLRKTNGKIFLWGILKNISVIGAVLCSIYLQKFAVEGMIERWQVKKIVLCLLGLLVLSVAMTILKNIAEINFSYIQECDRTRYLFDAENVYMRCGYDKAENFQYQTELEKVTDLVGTSNQNVGVNRFVHGMLDLFMNVTSFLVFGLILENLNIWVGCLILVTTLISSRWEYVLDKKEVEIRNTEGALADKRIDYFRRVLVGLDAAKDIRIYNCKKWLKTKIDGLISGKVGILQRIVKINSEKEIVTAVLEVVQKMVLIFWLIQACSNHTIMAAEILVYFTAAIQFSDSIRNIFSAVNKLLCGNEDMKIIREFLEVQQEETVSQNETEEPVEIEFRNVCFSYPGSEKEILSNINLHIKAGENIALVGKNGAGKTTLVKLLCGFYSASSGQILFNGKNISDMDQREVYQKVSAVFQNLVLIPYSVAQNVAIDEECPDMKRVRDCLEKAQILDTFPDINVKLDKRINENGIELSGGQKQRLAFARAIYKKAGILILDEPTAALDPIAERNLYENYHEIAKGKTTLFISHRLASTRFCDQIFVLDQGRIVERGSHQQLMEKNQVYAEMYALQSHYYNEGEGECS